MYKKGATANELKKAIFQYEKYRIKWERDRYTSVLSGNLE